MATILGRHHLSEDEERAIADLQEYKNYYNESLKERPHVIPYSFEQMFGYEIKAYPEENVVEIKLKNMTNQEWLEALAPYLPYKLECICHTNYDGSLNLKQTVFAIGESYITYRNTCSQCVDVQFADIKPILRPLSDLYEPCLEGGKVPIVELANMLGFYNLERYENDGVVDYGWTNGYYEGDCDTYILAWSEDLQTLGLWLDECEGQPLHSILNLKALNWLYAHHFWLGDQSEFGKTIININTLKQTNMNK